ncbi:hypothetical protein GCM10010207_56980 [Streptomyces atratus]|nr:hypothetical protein GCM10010207_56980 [Streptomyces atratus]
MGHHATGTKRRHQTAGTFRIHTGRTSFEYGRARWTTNRGLRPEYLGGVLPNGGLAGRGRRSGPAPGAQHAGGVVAMTVVQCSAPFRGR